MTTSQPKLPIICFGILAATLLFGALGNIGAAVLLYSRHTDDSNIRAAVVLAINGAACLTLAVLCLMSLWKLFKGRATARSFAGVTWKLLVGFTAWTLLFDGLTGWNTGSTVAVIIWGILATLIAIGLRQAQSKTATGPMA